MEYMSSKDAAGKWKVSLRYVQQLLHENRIPNATKCGASWLIPYNAERPADLRKVCKTKNTPGIQCIYFPTAPLLKKGKLDDSIKTLPHEYHNIASADIAYRRGNVSPALECWGKTPVSDIMKLTSASLAITAAICSNDFELYEEIKKYFQRCIAQTDDPRDKAMLSLPGTLAAVCMMVPTDMTPDWLVNADFSLFPRELSPFLLYLHAMYLRNIGDKKGVLSIAKAEIILCAQTNTFTWLDLNNNLLCASAYLDLGEEELARKYMIDAMDLGLPHAMIMPFADYYGSFGRLIDSCLESHYPEYRKPIHKLWEFSFKNWMKFHNEYTSENITTILTAQEYQLARMISLGATNADAAEYMHLSEGRIKNILSDVYGKLLINKRSRLSEFVL